MSFYWKQIRQTVRRFYPAMIDPQFASTFYFDQRLNIDAVKLLPGEYFVTTSVEYSAWLLCFRLHLRSA